jgi:hypothetical protein
MTTKTYLLDLGERVGSTFAEAFLAFLAGKATDVTALAHVAVWQGAAGAGVASVLALAKGLMARGVGNPQSAGLVPAVVAGAAGAGVGSAVGAAVGTTIGDVVQTAGKAVTDIIESAGDIGTKPNNP